MKAKIVIGIIIAALLISLMIAVKFTSKSSSIPYEYREDISYAIRSESNLNIKNKTK